MTTASAPGPSVPPVPRYGDRSLSDLLPAVLAALGVVTRPPGPAPAGVALPPARRVLVLLVDGLGRNQLGRAAAAAPVLSGLDDLGAVTVGFPTTTVTSLASLGTGRPPGEHGLTGYEMYLPETGRPLNGLRWDPAVDPVALQPHPTAFDRAAEAGVAVTRVGPRAFEGRGLSAAALRGGAHVGADTPGELVAACADALRRAERALVFCYSGDLDRTGHLAGCGSAAWLAQLGHVDLLVAQLLAGLPEDALLLVTADHGMVDAPAGGRLDLAVRPDLLDGVRLVTGEPRVAYLHTEVGALADVAAAWRAELGDRAWVLTRDEAVGLGLYGAAVRPEVLPRIGDLVVAMRGDAVVVDSHRMSRGLLDLVGYHGSLTEDELLVPLLSGRR